MSTGAFDAKERVREATDIVELIGAAHELRRQGSMFVTHCPFHDDNKPSLQVNPNRQTWKCWPCDRGGDVFSFVMETEGVSFPEALKMLADRAGIEIATTPQPKAKPGSPDDKHALLAAVDWAVKQYHDCLLKSHDAEVARNYLQQRQLSDESIRRYSVGFAPNDWQWIINRAQNTPYSKEVLEAAGLVIRSDNGRFYDRYRGRVVFPIYDPQKRSIGVGGRILPEYADDKSAKYINSPETRLYTKSDVLYGLDVAREDDKGHKNASPEKLKDRGFIVMEGYTDVMMTRQFGIEYVVAVCGTALTDQHIRLMKRYSDKVTLVLDGDTAGQAKSSSSALLEMFLAHQVDLRVVTLPEGLDPCDFLLRAGAESFRTFLDSAPDVLEHKIRVSTRGLDPIRDTHRANVALQELLTAIARTPKNSRGDAVNQQLREQQVLNRISHEFRIDEVQLRNQVAALRRSTKPHFSPTPQNTSPHSPPPAMGPNNYPAHGSGGFVEDFDPAEFAEPDLGPTTSYSATNTNAATPPSNKPWLTNAERQLFELLLYQPDAIPTMLENVAISSLQTDSARMLYEKYADLEADGEHADLHRLMDEYDDPAIKNLLVGLDEEAHRKAASDFDFALREAMQRFNTIYTEGEIREEQATISKVSEDEAVRMLHEIVRKRREVSETQL
ncbi:MAG: DNA primase [Planctomycetales bacterium]|nr:DNA primase [Planctomycetales bacterium]